MDWILGNPTHAQFYVHGERLQVWMRNGDVREVFGHYACAPYLMFTDCTHPLQNMCCVPDDIMGWRLVRLPS
jgi:hypothetical protein